MYMYTHSSQYRDTGWAEEVKNVTALNAPCQGNLCTCHFGHACRSFVSPGLEYVLLLGLESMGNPGVKG
jgi:hypothetical protein